MMMMMMILKRMMDDYFEAELNNVMIHEPALRAKEKGCGRRYLRPRKTFNTAKPPKHPRGLTTPSALRKGSRLNKSRRTPLRPFQSKGEYE